MKTLSILMATAALAGSATLVGAQQRSTPAPQGLSRQIENLRACTLQEQVADVLSVGAYTLQRIALPASIGSNFTATVDLGGRPCELVLHRSSMLAQGFQLLVEHGVGQLSDETGSMQELPTFRGVVPAIADSLVGASVLAGQLQAIVFIDDGRSWIIQPLTLVDETADRDLYVVFHSDDSIADDFKCGVDEPIIEEGDYSPPTAQLGSALRQCEIAFDTDGEYYNANGSSVTATTNDLLTVMNLVAVIFERDIFVRFRITAIIIRTSSSSDPYSGNDPMPLLYQLRNYWDANLGYIQSDTTHLMTGRNLAGSVIGIAFGSAICTLNGYALSQTKFTSNLNRRAALTAHEVGHNYSAAHCSGPNCRIMCPSLGGCTGIVTSFGGGAVFRMTNFSETRNCTPILDLPVSLPFRASFEFSSIDDSLWLEDQGAVTTDAAPAEPDGTQALNLDSVNDLDYGQDYIHSRQILLAGHSQLYLRLFTMHQGPALGELLRIDYLKADDTLGNLLIKVSDGSVQTSFEEHIIPLPAAAYHDGFRLFIQVTGDSEGDDWYLDDVEVSDGCRVAAEYCVAAPSSASVWGSLMLATGTSSLAANDLVITAIDGPAGQSNIFFYGPQAGQIAFGNGWLCITGGQTRLAVNQFDAAGRVSISFDAVAAGILPGETVYFQNWYRDPGGGGAAFNLSNGLKTRWCP